MIVSALFSYVICVYVREIKIPDFFFKKNYARYLRTFIISHDDYADENVDGQSNVDESAVSILHPLLFIFQCA